MNIIRGKRLPPQRRVIYGPPGVGKTKFACSEPGVVALSYERGVEYLGVPYVQGAPDWEASLALAREACTGQGDHTGVVFDTIDRIEAQCAAYTCKQGVDGKKKPTLADYGFNAGFEALAARWREFLFELEKAEQHNRSVTLVAHVQRTTIKDPTVGDHGGFIAALTKLCWSVTHQWADCVLFANYEQGMVDGRVVMTGNRILHTVKGTGFEAKHRPNIASPLPLSWQAYADAVAAANRSPDEIRASIRALLKPEQREQAEESLKKMGEDTGQLIALESALKRKLTP